MKEFDVIIIGAGVSGAALLYTLSKYTNIKNIAILEKYDAPATINSAATSNSQTIHCGDIETNYTLEKAKIVKQSASILINYIKNHKPNLASSHQKLALAVGEEECQILQNRYEEFKNLYPYLKLFDKEKLKEIEPNVIITKNGLDRKEPILAMGALTGELPSTIDYGELAINFLENALEHNENIKIFYKQEANIIKEHNGTFEIITKSFKNFHAKAVIVNAGAYSLYLAHKMGLGYDMSCLSVAGSFYMSKKKILNGKVYMMQNPKLPFAALHGDPDILANENTRFGPTALVIPKLERYKGYFSTMGDFFKTLRFDKNILKTILKLLKDKSIRNYILYNYLFEIPLLNKKIFVKNARKIVPSLKASDIYYARGFGGVRPQIIEKNKAELNFGEASIKDKDGIIFNMTPSPGATSCLYNAKNDAIKICEYLNASFDMTRFDEDLCK